MCFPCGWPLSFVCIDSLGESPKERRVNERVHWLILIPIPQSNYLTLYHHRRKRKPMSALVGWLSWLEHHSVHQKVAVLIPSQGTYLDCEFGPQSGHLWKATNQWFSVAWIFLSFSLPLSLCLSPYPTSLSLKSINISSGEGCFFLNPDHLLARSLTQLLKEGYLQDAPTSRSLLSVF